MVLLILGYRLSAIGYAEGRGVHSRFPSVLCAFAPLLLILLVVIRTKSVYSPIERKKDGLRILATRFRGRGLPKARYDVWMASLGPSEQLLTKILRGRISWGEFSRRYRKEILGEEQKDKANRTIKNHGQKFTLRLLQHLAKRGPVTVMCHCAEEEPHCHRHLLQALIQKI